MSIVGGFSFADRDKVGAIRFQDLPEATQKHVIRCFDLHVMPEPSIPGVTLDTIRHWYANSDLLKFWVENRHLRGDPLPGSEDAVEEPVVLPEPVEVLFRKSGVIGRIAKTKMKRESLTRIWQTALRQKEESLGTQEGDRIRAFLEFLDESSSILIAYIPIDLGERTMAVYDPERNKALMVGGSDFLPMIEK